MRMSSRTYSVFIVMATFIAFSKALAQNKIGYPQKNTFSFQNIESSVVPHEDSFPLNAARFFGTLTLTLATSTSIYTITTTTTCTTSTAAIKVCSPSKGRRRRENFGIHRLIFEEEDFDSDIFASRKPEYKISKQVSATEQNLNRYAGQTYEESLPIPFFIEPGFRMPEFVGSGRFLIAFGTTTVIATTTSTYSYTLTATCLSTTGYQTCGTGSSSLYGREGESDEFK